MQPQPADTPSTAARVVPWLFVFGGLAALIAYILLPFLGR